MIIKHGEDMKTADNWTARYEDFLACSDRLTEELDRFERQMRASKAMLDQAGKYTEHVDAISKQISGQVERAQVAWSKADDVAAQAAKVAYSSAFESVRSSLDTITDELARSVQANTRATVLVNQSFTQSRNFIILLGGAFVIVSALAIFAAVYLASIRPSSTDLEMSLNAARFELIWHNADKQEQIRLLKLLQRSPK